MTHTENFGKRFCAFLLDVFMLYMIFILLGMANKTLGLFSPFWATGICYGITILYFSLMESGKHQATIGKSILGLMVVHKDTDEPITFARALGRNLARLINLPIYCLGYLTIFFTKNNQGVHDLIMQTKVVPALYDDEEDLETDEE